MSKQDKWWQGDDARHPQLSEAAKQLDGLSPAQAYLARQLAQLYHREQEHAQAAAELRATVSALKDLLLESGVLDEAALATHIAQARAAKGPATGADTEEELESALPDVDPELEAEVDAWVAAEPAPAEPAAKDQPKTRAPASAQRTARGGTRLGPGLLGALPRQTDQGPQTRTTALEREAPREPPAATRELLPPETEPQSVGYPRATASDDREASAAASSASEMPSAEAPVSSSVSAASPPSARLARPTPAPDYDDYDDEALHGSGKGRRIAGILFVVAVLIGVPAWYFGVYKNPYAGDGPAHLQVDPSRVRTPEAAAGKPAQPAATAKTVATTKSAEQPAAAAAGKPAPTSGTARGVSPTGAPAGAPAAPRAAVDPAQARYTALMERAQALFAKRRAGPAYQLVRKASKLKPDGWEALERLAWFYYSRGAAGKGRKLAKRALATQPNAPYALLVQAAAAHERGQRAVAKAGYQRFLALCKGCPEAADIKAALRSL